MNAEVKNIGSDSTTDAAALQLYLETTLSLDSRVKEEKEKLIEKILETMSQKVKALPSVEGKVEYITKTRDKLSAIKEATSDVVSPVLDKAIQFLNAQLAETKETLAVATSPRSRRKQMSVAIASQAELYVKTGNEKTGVTPAAEKSEKITLSAPKGSSKLSPGLGGSLPAPNLPPTGCPDLPTDGTDWQMTDPNGAAMKFFLYLDANPTDPTAMMKLMNFLASGNVSPEIDQFMESNCTLFGSSGGIKMFAKALTQYSFFAGYGNATPGQASMTAFLSDMINNLGGRPQDRFITEMVNQFNVYNNPAWIQQFTNSHTAGPGPDQSDPITADYPNGIPVGDLYWTYDGYTYDWTNPGKRATNDQDMIMAIMNGQADSGTVNPWIASINILKMNQMYRTSTLAQLLHEFKDPLFAITLWILISCDTTTESTISSNDVGTGLLTQGTDFPNELADSISAFSTGSGSDTDTANFTRALFGGALFFDEHPQMGDIQSTYQTSVYNGLNSIPVTVMPATTPPTTLPLGDMIQHWMQGQTGVAGYPSLTAMLNATFNASPSSTIVPAPGSSTTYTPNPNAQTASNICNQFSSILTGQTKTLSTQIATETSADTAIIKTGDALTSMVKMNEKVVAHFND